MARLLKPVTTHPGKKILESPPPSPGMSDSHWKNIYLAAGMYHDKLTLNDLGKNCLLCL